MKYFIIVLKLIIDSVKAVLDIVSAVKGTFKKRKAKAEYRKVEKFADEGNVDELNKILMGDD